MTTPTHLTGVGRIAEIDHRGHRLGVDADADTDGLEHYRLTVLGGHVSDTPLGVVGFTTAGETNLTVDTTLADRLGIDLTDLTAQVVQLADVRASAATAYCLGIRWATGPDTVTIGS
ncbi:hypothetical protein LO763_20165 [Glycomyces sp. A-F 0318]|uniref:hypothetical protein n=1 Tax=Glycomyces amatae TaxID=2881355 RepID=UPI001E58376E|nr:hypothetical protein [Glycomyces amatae]MCD0445930.1 hypothetical protein [Glycomyces amatae]